MSFDATDQNFSEWGNFFHENGYIILNNAIPQNTLENIKHDLFNLNIKNAYPKNKKYVNRHIVHKCFFENSKSTVDLVESGVVVDFAQYIIGDIPGEKRGNSLNAHLIHNNAFTIPPNGRGQAAKWHVDDPVQQVIVPDGHMLPEYIKLPVLVVTYMIWLSDCTSPENGPTYVVPKSHRFGQVVDPIKAEPLGIPMTGKAGTAILINSQTWHRGCENKSTIPRETLQLTFGRRIIGHKFKTIMNYHMPEHVLKGRSKETCEKMGHLEGGAYS